MSNYENKKNRSEVKTFVGGLPSHAQAADLEKFMSQFGTISEVYVPPCNNNEKDQKNHKGFAFVTFSQINSLEKLLREHHFFGRTIDVKKNIQCCAYLSSLPPSIQESDIQQALEKEGLTFYSVKLPSSEDNCPPGHAMIKAKNQQALRDLMRFGGIKILGNYYEFSTRVFKKHHPQGRYKDSKDYGYKNKRDYHDKTDAHYKFTETNPEEERKRRGFEDSHQSHKNRSNIQGHESEVSMGDKEDPFFTNAFNDSHIPINQLPYPLNETSKKIEKDGQRPGRKMSSSLQTNSKEYRPPSHMPENLFGSPGAESQGFNQIGSDPLSLSMGDSLSTRLYSDCGLSSQEYVDPQIQVSKRLGGNRFPFFAPLADGVHLPPPAPLTREVQINYFTFPGRE